MKVGQQTTNRGDERPSASWGYCDLVLSAPDDAQIYQCFANLVQRWDEHVTRERLWLEHDIPITPCFREPGVPATLARLFEAAPFIIARVEVEVAGLCIRYLRTGGHLPFRKSFFDTLEFEVEHELSISVEELRDLLGQFCSCLHIVMARGSALFARLAAELTTQAPQRPSAMSARSWS